MLRPDDSEDSEGSQEFVKCYTILKPRCPAGEWSMAKYWATVITFMADNEKTRGLSMEGNQR